MPLGTQTQDCGTFSQLHHLLSQPHCTYHWQWLIASTDCIATNREKQWEDDDGSACLSPPSDGAGCVKHAPPLPFAAACVSSSGARAGKPDVAFIFCYGITLMHWRFSACWSRSRQRDGSLRTDRAAQLESVRLDVRGVLPLCGCRQHGFIIQPSCTLCFCCYSFFIYPTSWIICGRMCACCVCGGASLSRTVCFVLPAGAWSL